jgi:hypothetical protein
VSEKSFKDTVSELRRLMGMPENSLAETDGPAEGDLKAWEAWSEKTVGAELDEAKKKKPSRPVIKKHCEACSLKCFQENIRHFYHVSDMDTKQAVAASYSILRKACGTPKDAPQMTPKEIVGKSESRDLSGGLAEKISIGPSTGWIRVAKTDSGDWEWSAEGERSDALPKGTPRTVKKDGKEKTRKAAFEAAFRALEPISSDAPEGSA